MAVTDGHWVLLTHKRQSNFLISNSPCTPTSSLANSNGKYGRKENGYAYYEICIVLSIEDPYIFNLLKLIKYILLYTETITARSINKKIKIKNQIHTPAEET